MRHQQPPHGDALAALLSRGLTPACDRRSGGIPIPRCFPRRVCTYVYTTTNASNACFAAAAAVSPPSPRASSPLFRSSSQRGLSRSFHLAPRASRNRHATSHCASHHFAHERLPSTKSTVSFPSSRPLPPPLAVATLSIPRSLFGLSLFFSNELPPLCAPFEGEGGKMSGVQEVQERCY